MWQQRSEDRDKYSKLLSDAKQDFQKECKDLAVSEVLVVGRCCWCRLWSCVVVNVVVVNCMSRRMMLFV